MSSRLRSVLFVALVGIAGATLIDRAHALSARSLYGKWCTAGGSEEFEDDYLIVNLRSGDRHRFKIKEYEVGRDTVTVHWINSKGNHVTTDFGEFSADGKRMVQIRNEEGPRREFRRCR